MLLKTPEDIVLAKELVSTPGDTLAELIKHKSITKAELADRMALSDKHISEIINGKSPITPETAKNLERVLDMPAQFWLAREHNYQLELTEIKQAEEHLENLAWLDKFPLAEMAKLNWLPSGKKCLETFEAILSFFAIANIQGFEHTFMEVNTARYRISLKRYTNPYALAAWLRKGEKEAGEAQIAAFNESRFKEILNSLKPYIINHTPDIYKRVSSDCAEAGVLVLHTPNLINTPTFGATRWKGNTPVIQLSHNLATNDRYWFTFYHEAGHVLLHPKTKVYVDEINNDQLDQDEKEANEFAQRFLYSEAAYQQAKTEYMSFNLATITDFAHKLHTHPGVVLGRLQHDKLINWASPLNSLKGKMDYKQSIN